MSRVPRAPRVITVHAVGPDRRRLRTGPRGWKGEFPRVAHSLSLSFFLSPSGGPGYNWPASRRDRESRDTGCRQLIRARDELPRGNRRRGGPTERREKRTESTRQGQEGGRREGGRGKERPAARFSARVRGRGRVMVEDHPNYSAIGFDGMR